MRKLIAFGGLVLTVLWSCSITRPFAITSNEIGDKVGKVSCTCIGTPPPESIKPPVAAAGVLCFGTNNFSIFHAARKAGITRVATVDLKITNYVFFTKYELIVHGK